MALMIPNLKRYPEIPNDLLQAWDAADELMLKTVSGMDLSGKRVIILNDQFGALSSTLSEHQVTSYTDSFVSDQAIRANSEGAVWPIHSFSDFKGLYDLALIKLPKNLSFFEDELCQLTAHLKSDALVMVGGMVKHMPAGAFDLIQKYLGETRTSLAEKKARLIFAEFKKEKAQSPYPKKVKIESFEKPFTHYSNLFSREKLDIGTRFLLEHIPTGPFQTILDLGCANGIIGIAAKMKNSDSKIIFSDESVMAVKSAKENYQQYFTDEAKFLWTNCFEKQEKESVDLVLCNPPFHQQNAIGDFIARQMFQDSCHAMKKGALIRVIGNGHLDYPLKLKKIFGNSQIIAKNSKFVIVDAIRKDR